MTDEGGRKCANGHIMDPNWERCPYCEAESKSGQKMVMSEQSSTVVLGNSETNSNNAVGTLVGEQLSEPQGLETVVLPSADASQAAVVGNVQDTRKIVGVLVTYSWVPSGQLFPLREGKNHIGRSNNLPEHRCDIQIADDKKMSGDHALILCRSGKNELIDRESSNGTFLDGKLISSKLSYELGNNAEIKTGSTIWTFVSIGPPETL